MNFIGSVKLWEAFRWNGVITPVPLGRRVTANQHCSLHYSSQSLDLSQIKNLFEILNGCFAFAPLVLSGRRIKIIYFSKRNNKNSRLIKKYRK